MTGLTRLLIRCLRLRKAMCLGILKMNDDLKETIQILSEWKKELDTAVPAIANTAKQIMISPEVQAMVEISNKTISVLTETIKRFAELTAPYAELARDFTNSVAPILIEIAHISLSLSVIARLGKIQYVAWKTFPKEFYEQASATNSKQDLLELVVSWVEDNDFGDIENTIKSLSETDQLKYNLVFSQAIGAYRRKEYDLACLGLTAMLDRLLSDFSGMITSTSISKRVKEIENKVSINGEEGLDEFELNDFILIATFTSAVDIFGETRKFDAAEPDLNRHWIAHGRMDRSMKKIDCIRLINILYGTILMNQLAERITEKDE